MAQGTGKADWQRVFSDGTDSQPELVPGKRLGTKDLGKDGFFESADDLTRVCFVDFVKEDNGVRTFSKLLGQLTTFLVADVAGRRPDQLRHFVLLLKIRIDHNALSNSFDNKQSNEIICMASPFFTNRLS